MPRSWNLSSGAPRPGNVDLYNKMISKINFFERGSRIQESGGERLEGGEQPDPGIWARERSGLEIAISIRKGRRAEVLFYLFVFTFYFFIR